MAPLGALSDMPTTITGAGGVSQVQDGSILQADLDNTTSFAGTKTTSGYQKLPNGLILQWGNTAISANGQAVSFGTAFPTACISVTVTPNIGSAPTAANLVGVNGLTASQFNVWFGTAQSIFWVAIGY